MLNEERSPQTVGRRVRSAVMARSTWMIGLNADPLLATGHRLSFSGGSTVQCLRVPVIGVRSSSCCTQVNWSEIPPAFPLIPKVFGRDGPGNGRKTRMLLIQVTHFPSGYPWVRRPDYAPGLGPCG